MAYTYPVKWITSEMRGAPVLNGTPGTLIAVLDAFLLTGWGAATAISVEVLDGVGTAIFNAGITFTQHAVVAISGATPAALNGEARVLTSAGDRITFETDAPNGTATGSIVFKFAPQGGWEKAFSGTNKAVYRSTDAQSAKHCLRVDDAGTTTARVVGYEAMSDVDSGVGPFPTAAQVSGGGYVHKSTVASAQSIPYIFAASARTALWSVRVGAGTWSSVTPGNLRGFGAAVALAPGGDAWASFLSVSCSSSLNFFDSGSLCGGPAGDVSTGVTFMARGLSGLGSAVPVGAIPYTGTLLALSGSDALMGAAPSVVDGAVYLSRVFLREVGGPPRAIVPGVAYVPQSGLQGFLTWGGIVQGGGEFSGRRLIAVTTGSYSASAYGIALIDITGPW